LPIYLAKKDINIFINKKIGHGLMYSLISKGIKPVIKEELKMSDFISL
jgi:predicted Fe-Mo cluster-binding NifX family protein